jgi:hypothetical protein
VTEHVATQQASYRRRSERSMVAVGLIAFAGVMMLLAGGFAIMTGLVALFNDEFYVSTRDYTFKFDITTWGWIQLILGALLVLGGIGVLLGWLLGRIIGIVLAVLSAFANFAFIPWYPFWSLGVILLDVFVIWALVAHSDDIVMRDDGR